MKTFHSIVYFLLVIAFSFLFSACEDDKNTYYEITEDTVVYHYVKRKASNFFTASYHERLVAEADPKSFTSLIKKYAKDKNHVYFEGINLGVRDVNTFKILEESFTVDKLAAYYQNQIIEGSDGSSFKLLNSYYYQDKNHIYVNTGSNVEAVDSIDFKSFKLVQNEYAKDKNHLFYNGNILEGLSNTNFKILSNNYCIDPSVVYYKSLKVDANAAYFQVLEYGYAKDDKNIFFEDININADYESFKIVDRKKDPSNNYLAEDKYFYYAGVTATKK